MSQSTIALILPKVGATLELREINLAALQPDEVLVEIHATGLCHTDLSFANGTLPCSPNAVLGHEGTLTTFRRCLSCSRSFQLQLQKQSYDKD